MVASSVIHDQDLYFSVLVFTPVPGPPLISPLFVVLHNNTPAYSSSFPSIPSSSTITKRSIVADFISSLSALSIPAPSITSWWSATSLYSPVSPTCLLLGRVFLDDACSQASPFCKDN
ncbi:hypothetical protein ZIOFF_005215 [Zingiber officinale]|uniref:Uncharacterized protein n=1 Tax=Zingiber officinale TaxID=94328 RepID=A0A8J5IC39_ZINOF|nr:hypothetical protein ZIOFF_005215 [Zingiber officinale]